MPEGSPLGALDGVPGDSDNHRAGMGDQPAVQPIDGAFPGGDLARRQEHGGLAD